MDELILGQNFSLTLCQSIKSDNTFYLKFIFYFFSLIIIKQKQKTIRRAFKESWGFTLKLRETSASQEWKLRKK